MCKKTEEEKKMENIGTHDDNKRDSSKQIKEQETWRERLSKRLTYILRYGALKEGVQVSDSGRYIL